MIRYITAIVSITTTLALSSWLQAATAPAPGYGPTPGPTPSAAPGIAPNSTTSSSPNSPLILPHESAAPTGKSSTEGNALPLGLTTMPESLWTRENLLGGLDGGRDLLINHGVTFAPVYTGEVMGNLTGGAGGYNGQGKGFIYEHSLNLPVDLDLVKIFPWWQTATVHANALWIAGPGLSPSYTGDISNTSNIQGYNTIRLQELWYQQAFWGQRASLKIGEIAADSEFFTSDSASLFLNGTFGAFTFVGSNLPDPYDANVYPVASPGVRLLLQPVSFFYFQTGVFNGTAESQVDNPHGVNFPFDSSDGALIFSEIGFPINQSPNARGWQGTYKIGSFIHTHNFNSWSSQQNNSLTGAGLQSSGSDYGIYGVADQQLFSDGERTISSFVRAGGAPSDINVISAYLDGGFDFQGFVPTRPDDTLGLAVSRSMFSKDFSNFEVNANSTATYDAETVFEATYKYQLAPWWTVQPDVQYIFTPSGQEGSPDAVILGVRTTLVF